MLKGSNVPTNPKNPNTMTQQKLKVLYFDGAIAYGGTISLLKMLFKDFDRKEITPKLISALPQSKLLEHFQPNDIATSYTSNLSYVSKNKWNQITSRLPLPLHKLAAYLFTTASLLSNLPSTIKIFYTLAKESPDILHINNSNTPLLAAYLLNIPVIWHFHGVPEKQSRWYKLLHSKISTYLSISDYIQHRAISSGYPEQKTITLHNPAPKPYKSQQTASAFFSLYNIKKESIVISHIGRLITWKGQLEFLRAFALAHKENCNLHALIIGDDTEKFGSSYRTKLLQVVNENNLTEKVSFLGQVNTPLEALSHSDIIVHSSLEPEPFGLVITEAMSVGAAVICSNKGAGQEIIENGISGIICDPNNLQELKTNILNLAQDSVYRKSLSDNALRRAQTVFSLETYIYNLMKLYNSTLKTTIEKQS